MLTSGKHHSRNVNISQEMGDNILLIVSVLQLHMVGDGGVVL
jgi:hypothetical protein